MHHDTLDFVEYIEANSHLSPPEIIKTYYGYDFLLGWKRDGTTNIKEMLQKLNDMDITEIE